MSFKEILVIAVETKPFELALLVFMLSIIITNICFYIVSKTFREFINNLLFEEEDEEYIELTLTQKEWESLKKQIQGL